MAPSSQYTCPACGFLVFDEPPGSYEICDVCGWEDDHVQLANPMMGGGANRESLNQAQQRVLKTHPVTIQLVGGHRRDAGWRPLTDSDLQAAPVPPRNGISYFEAAGASAPDYYWRTGSSSAK